jgi:RNA recognition motif-containing protein
LDGRLFEDAAEKRERARMSYRLYVGNLASDVSQSALSAFFATCGEVQDTQISMDDEYSERPRVSALVTMTKEDDANLAVARLNGAQFEKRTLRVSMARSKNGAGSAAKEAARKARITSQFRERSNMTYELECAGAPLIVRVFPLRGDVEEWRIEARESDACTAAVATATAASRAKALDIVALWWRENARTRALTAIDWDAVAQAMKTVGAL